LSTILYTHHNLCFMQVSCDHICLLPNALPLLTDTHKSTLMTCGWTWLVTCNPSGFHETDSRRHFIRPHLKKRACMCLLHVHRGLASPVAGQEFEDSFIQGWQARVKLELTIGAAQQRSCGCPATVTFGCTAAVGHIEFALLITHYSFDPHDSRLTTHYW